MEITKKKNTDYSASAVRLVNPTQVMDLLVKYHGEVKAQDIINEQIDSFTPSLLKDQKVALEKLHQETDKALRQAIDEFGSYQDTESGEYALKQRRESISYKPELVRQYAPSKVASFVLVESVDTKAMEAMIKAGQITPEAARGCGEVKESYVYIIK